jgi:hypothetical protein
MPLTLAFRSYARFSWIRLSILFLLFAPAILHAEETGPKGSYIEIGGQTDPAAIGIGLGGFNYNYRYLSTRMALYVLGSESVDDVFFGADAGVRMELGTRVSPFVGLGGYYGYHSDQIPAENDKLDNDGDGQVDEDGEKDVNIDRSMATIYPEAGLHIWIDNVNRLTLSGKYHITTEGRDSDFWLFCFGIYFPIH